MSYYDGFEKGCFPCGESYFDKQQFDGFDKKFDGYDKKPFDGYDCYDKKQYNPCCIDKKFLMECELKCKPCRPKPVCPPKPKCFPFFGCFCFKTPPKKDCW